MPPTLLISLRLPRDLAVRVGVVARERGWTRTRVVVEAVGAFVERIEMGRK